MSSLIEIRFLAVWEWPDAGPPQPEPYAVVINLRMTPPILAWVRVTPTRGNIPELLYDTEMSRFRSWFM